MGGAVALMALPITAHMAARSPSSIIVPGSSGEGLREGHRKLPLRSTPWVGQVPRVPSLPSMKYSARCPENRG